MTDAAELIAELRAAMEGVTPGPWTVFFDGSDKCWLKVGAGGMPDYFSDTIVVGPCENDKDAEFLSTCEPGNIRLLLDHIETLEARVATLSAAKFSADESELLITWPDLQISIGADGTGYCFIRDGKFVPGKYSILDEPIEAAKEIIAAREASR